MISGNNAGGPIRLPPNSVLEEQVDLGSLGQDLAKYLPEHLLNSV